jgi:hypothetical protein
MFSRSPVVWLRRLMRSDFAGQGELKRCTPPGVGTGPKTSAMRFNDRTADTKSHAGAMRFGSKERVKDLIRLLRRKPHAGIADRNREMAVFGLLRAE